MRIAKCLSGCASNLCARSVLRLTTAGNNGKISSRNYSSQEKSKIIPSIFDNIEIPNVPFGTYILDKTDKFAHKVALIDGETEEEWTYARVKDSSLSLASALSRLGFGKGDKIAIVSPNCPEYLVSFIAVSLIGATSTTVNTTYTVDEIIKQIENSESVCVLSHSLLVPKCREAKVSCPNLRSLICIDEEHDGFLSMKKLFNDDGKAIPNVQIDAENDLLVLPYSSGTTGLPKGVMLTHQNIVANLEQMLGPKLSLMRSEIDAKEVFVGILPMFHIYGMVVQMLISAIFGGKLITLKSFEPKQYLQTLAKYQPTFLHSVPPILGFLSTTEAVPPSLLKNTHTILCGAAPAGPALVGGFLKKFGKGIAFQEGYGMTEASPVTHLTPPHEIRMGSCGTAVPNTLTKFVDVSTGEEVDGTIQEGEICVQGPQVMKGYLNNEEATQETIKDGWLHTGDIGRIDDDSFVYIVDRLKELIKVKGLQVAPAELEDVLRSHPAVADVAVIGVPDERSGELPKAFIVTSKSVSEEDLKKYVAERVAPHKNLEGGVEFIEKIPKSGTGKILRKDLKNI